MQQNSFFRRKNERRSERAGNHFCKRGIIFANVEWNKKIQSAPAIAILPTSFFLSTRKQASNETRKDIKPKIVERGGGDGVRGREIGAGGELWARGRYSKTFNNYSGRR